MENLIDDLDPSAESVKTTAFENIDCQSDSGTNISDGLVGESLPDFDLTGTYKTKITGPVHYFVGGRKTPKIKIEQNGGNLLGTFEKNLVSITGHIKGNTITFEWTTARGEGGNGLLTVGPENSELFGAWNSQPGSGEMVLKRVE